MESLEVNQEVVLVVCMEVGERIKVGKNRRVGEFFSLFQLIFIF